MRKLQQQFTVDYSYPVFFSRDVFNTENQTLASSLLQGGNRRHKIFCVADSGVMARNPFLRRKIECYAEAYDTVINLCSPIQIIEGGENCKNRHEIIETLIDDIRRHHLCRQSFVLAIGGGAVLDAVGYAAAIAHRGLRLIRMPTTVLAQNDAGVGVKNGINAMGRKNFLGTFAPPFTVINDSLFLDTLPERQLRAGIAEAVKVALIKDMSFFDYLYAERHNLAVFERRSMEEMIHHCAALHIEHIGKTGDPFESGSSRPLDFGHWSAHKLEELTNGKINHGEAVSVGIALDTSYSHSCGLIGTNELEQVISLLADLGLPLYHPSLLELDVEEALNEFQEHLGGERAITLLTGIGRKMEVNRIDISVMKECITELALRFRKRNTNSDITIQTNNVCQEIN